MIIYNTQDLEYNYLKKTIATKQDNNYMHILSSVDIAI